MKELIRKILKEESLLIKLRRRADLNNLDKLINRFKLISFNKDGTVGSSVTRTINRVADHLIPENEPEDDEQEYIQIFRDFTRYLRNTYGVELTDYFEKRKEEFVNRKESDVRYIFAKHSEGYYDIYSGFKQGFKYFYDLVSEYGNWIDVDWDKIKYELDKINYYPEDKLNGWVESRPLRISSKGDKGNDWEYNFSIVKSIKK